MAGSRDKPKTRVNASGEEKKSHPEETYTNIKLSPFTVIAGSGDKAMTQSSASRQVKKFHGHPQENSSMTMLKMKEMATATTPSKMKEVTVAYP